MAEAKDNTAGVLLGIDRRELIQQPLSRCIDPDDQTTFDLHCRQVFKTRVRQVCEIGMVKTDGTPFYAQL